MTQVGEAVARYHKILETEPYRDLSWAREMHEKMRARNLVVGERPISPFLRPHFISRRQYTNLTKAAECLNSAIDRMEKVALASPTLLSRMELLPAEKMLASVDPGYSFLSVTSQLDTQLHNGTVRFLQYNSEAPSGVVYSEALSDLFCDAPPLREFRKKYKIEKLASTKPLMQAVLRAWKEWGGKGRKPNIAILEFRQPFATAESNESQLIAEAFRREGYATEIISPDQLDYRNGALYRGDYRIDLIYRRIRVHEFLVRFDLNHPLLRAYRDGAVCVVNNFRSEVARKRAIFDLLTDDTVVADFPAAEKKAIRDFIPWTRRVAAAHTTWQEERVDLPDFILKNREKLVLTPNDDSTEQSPVRGAETDRAAWEKALRVAMRSPWVVQEVVEPVSATFPVYQYGNMSMREMRVDLHPHSCLGKVQGCSAWLTSGAGSFSTLSGLAPTLIVESK
ncbi:MAG TPA: circularly permuted type 2 ATP-grasp protein [Bryobacteraceae bacterium]|nr:circularly permuted type 2 ATP-grasp protein [Bryobacteraceae bacterium]